jgi:hypothetical protein
MNDVMDAAFLFLSVIDRSHTWLVENKSTIDGSEQQTTLFLYLRYFGGESFAPVCTMGGSFVEGHF